MVEIILRDDDIEQGIRMLRKVSSPILGELKLREGAMTRTQRRAFKDRNAARKRKRREAKMRRLEQRQGHGRG